LISPLSVFLHCFTHSFLFLYRNFDFFTFCRSRLLDLEHLWCYHLFQIMHFSSKVYFLFELTLPCNKPYQVELNYNWIAWFTSIYDSVYGSHVLYVNCVESEDFISWLNVYRFLATILTNKCPRFYLVIELSLIVVQNNKNTLLCNLSDKMQSKHK
jgi:hypothetical protein